ncbi:CHRD domain-containing protein [Haloactinopolyspora alba]|uniref:CHRD domain-containing protein n=1 Tax=Haloactinopolyspora alba TaxID=648780 RepID=A0A2P8DZ10_9ACTN|nr:CHRD domain-containing protein [Haloactinopolyspora alba]PSL02468.1 CHRD domain-containing protein [Haloactinopolyspora alba]
MRHTRALLAVPAAFALTAAGAAPAMADSSEGQPGDYSITMDQLNESGASGSAVITLEDNGDLTVKVEASGLVPNQPHAQHIHGNTDQSQDFVCPTPEADADGNGIVDTAEGIPSYGDIHISLTTKGDSTADSALAVDRMPVADAEGNVNYERTFSSDELPEGTAAAVRNLHVVQHGIDPNGNGEYDTDAGASPLDKSLPLEATAPAACGIIEGSSVSDMPDGGVDTGAGPMAESGSDGNVALTAVSIAAGAGLAGAAGVGLYRRRLAAQQ